MKQRINEWLALGRIPRRFRTIAWHWQSRVGKVHLYFISCAFASFWLSLILANASLLESRSPQTTMDASLLLTLAFLVFVVLFFIIATLRQMPKFNVLAKPKAMQELLGIGTTHYLTAGVLSPLVVYLAATADEGLGWPISLVIAGIILLNAIGVNYCIVKWNYEPAAQRDIGKMLLRVPVLLLLFLAATLVQSRGILTSAAVALSIFLLPLIFEVVVVIHKSKTRSEGGVGQGS